jgi:hypothetical protein
MLKIHYQELLTAYVDGELTARQRRLVLRLLRRSGEARNFLRLLQDDARQLRLVPARTIPVDLSGPILESIIRRKLQPKREPRVAVQRSFPIWTGAAAAAAVLLLVSAVVFVASSRDVARPGQGSAKKQQPPHEGPAPAPEQDLARAPQAPLPPSPAPAPRGQTQDEPEDKLPSEPVEKDRESTPKVKAPRNPDEPVLASGEDKEAPGKLERVELALPAIYKLHELDKTGAAGLRDQLANGIAFRVELPCKDATRAVDRLRAALADRKFGLVVDSIAVARLKKPTFKHDFALFLENVAPPELADLLARVGVADRAPPPGKKSPEPRFEGAVVVTAMSRWDRHELKGLFGGIDPLAVRPAIPASPPTVDIHRPLTEGTEAAVSATLEGKGVPRPTVAENVALLLPLATTRTPSVEVKRFLEARKPARPGTVQAFVVLRNVGP